MKTVIKEATQNTFATVSEMLKEDGWQIDVWGTRLECVHPEVTTEQDARRRLAKLNLLTSSSVSIAFLA